MYPENYIAAEFWHFTRRRAWDPVTPYDFGAVLKTLDEERCTYISGEDDGSERPVVYATIQDALLDFLIYFTTQTIYSPTYEIWLRTVSLVLAQAHAEPSRLTVQTPDPWDDTLSMQALENRLRDNSMVVSPENWDCINRDTFNYVTTTYRQLSEGV